MGMHVDLLTFVFFEERNQQSSNILQTMFQTVAMAGVACVAIPYVVGAAATAGVAGAAGAAAYVSGEYQRQQTNRRLIEAQTYVYGQSTTASPRLIGGSSVPYYVEEPE